MEFYMLKKTTLAMLSLVVNSLVFAGTMGCEKGSLSVPCPVQQWNVGIQALYLTPIQGLPLGYGIKFDNDDNERFKRINNNWDWGYRVEGSYHFNTGNDITINYTHFNTSSNPGNFDGLFPLLSPIGVIPFPTDFNLSLKDRYDQVNLVLGQKFDFDLRKNTRIYAGLQYASIHLDTNSDYDLPPPLLNATGGVRRTSNNEFTGFGAVIGFDYAYGMTESLSITANTATSLLYGNSRLNTAFIYADSLVVMGGSASKHALIPGFEAKLGANYAYVTASGVLNIQGGYQVVDYLNPLQSNHLLWVNSANYGLYGPYFGVQWQG
jgi:hypothetical protein